MDNPSARVIHCSSFRELAATAMYQCALIRSLAQSALLNDHGAVAVVLESLADEVVLEPDPGATPMWTEVRLEGVLSFGC